MKRSKRYLACFLAMLMAVGSINIGLATDVTISTEDLNPKSEEITTQSDQLETNTVSGNSIEEDVILEDEVQSNDELLSSDSNIQLITENDDLEPSEIDSELDDEALDNWELELVFYDSSVDGGKTPLSEINWNNASGTHIVTIQVNYKNTCLAKSYEPGEIEITIPNFGQRGCTTYYGPSGGIASPRYGGKSYYQAKEVSGGSSENFDWNYKLTGEQINEWKNNSKTDIPQIKYYTDYVFTNNVTFDEGSYVEGSFQLKYEVAVTNMFETDNFSIKASLNNNYSSNELLFSCHNNVCNFSYHRIAASAITALDGFPEGSDKYIWIRFDHIANLLTDTGRSLNDYRLKPSLDSENIKFLDSSFNEIFLDEEGMGGYSFLGNIGYNSGAYRAWIYIGYPIDEFENSSITQSFEIYGNWCDNSHVTETYKEEMELIHTFTLENLNINDFALDYSKDGGTSISLNTANTSSLLSYKTMKNGFMKRTFNVVSKAPYRGYSYDIRTGQDIFGYKDAQNNFRLLSDDEYYIYQINIDGVKDYNNNYYKADYDIYLRYAGNEEYTYFDSGNSNKALKFESEDKVVAYYLYYHDLNKGFKQTSIVGISSNKVTSDIPEEGEISFIGFIDRFRKDNETGEMVEDPISNDGSYASGMNEIKEKDLVQFGHYVLRDKLSIKYSNADKLAISPNWSFSKTPTKNQEKEQYEFQYQGGISFDVTSYVDVINGFSFYTLLPEGVDLNTAKEEIKNSIKFTNNDETLESFAKANGITVAELRQYLIDCSTVNVKENWNKSSRIKIEIITDFSERPISYMEGLHQTFSNFSITAQIPVKVSFESIQEFGELYTAWAFVDTVPSDNYEIGPGYGVSMIKDNGQKDPYTIDIDEDGNTEEQIVISNINGLSASIIYAVASHKDINAYVQTDTSNYKTGVVESSIDSEYNYKLRVRTGGSNSITNLVIYDNLEQAFGNNEHWNGEFLGIDTSYAESKGYNVKVYYSENQETGNLTDDSSWKEYSNSVDKSKVKSLAFEYLDADGNHAVIPQNSLTYVLINMKSINNSRIKSLAYNNFSATWNEINQYGTVSNTSETLISNIVKVSLPNSDKFGSYKITHQYYLKDIDGNLVLENEVEELSDDILIDTIIKIEDILVTEDQDKTYSYLGDLESFIIEEDIQKEITLSYVRDMEKPSYNITQTVEGYDDSYVTIKGTIENNSKSENVGLKEPQIIVSVDKDLKITSINATITDKNGNKISLTEDMYTIDEENNIVTFILGEDDKILNGDSFSYEIETIVVNGDENGNKDTLNTEVKVSGYLITEGEETSFWIENIEDEIFNIELQPSAKVKESSITIHPNGGSYDGSTNDTKITNIKYGTEIELSTPKRKGYTFTGWTIPDNSATLKDNTITMGYEDVEITANWEINQYKLTIDLNGGNVDDSEDDIIYTLDYGTEQELPTPVKPGYIFDGWDNSNPDSEIQDNKVTIGEGDTTLTAKWQLDSFDVTYIDIDSNGNELGRQVIKKPYNSVVKGSDLGSDKTDNAYYNGYVLDSWTESTVTLNGATVYRTFVTKTEDIIFHLRWNDNDNKDNLRPKNYTIELLQNGTVIDTITIASTQLTYSFSDLPQYDENGKAYIYRFRGTVDDRYYIYQDTDEHSWNEHYYIAEMNESYYSVIIPKWIVLDGETGIGNYAVGVEGWLYYNDTLTVKPADSLTLTDRSNISSMVATVTQEEISFKKDDLGYNYSSRAINPPFAFTAGSVQTKKQIFPGLWSGTFNFEIMFQKKN